MSTTTATITATIKRDTTADLFKATMKAAREAGELSKLDAIKDYESAEFHPVEISNYGFWTYFHVQYGGSEGIYIDAYIKGLIDETGNEKSARIGTIKTLCDDLESMKIMGEACGILTHFATKYVNQNIGRYTPSK